MTEMLLAKLRLNGCNSQRGSSDSTAAPSEKSCQEEHMVSEKMVVHCNTLENMQFCLALVCERLNAAIYIYDMGWYWRVYNVHMCAVYLVLYLGAVRALQ